MVTEEGSEVAPLSGVLAWSCLRTDTKLGISHPRPLGRSAVQQRSSGPQNTRARMQVFCLALPVILSLETRPSDGRFSALGYVRPDEETQGSKRCETIGWRCRVSTCTVMHVRDPDSTKNLGGQIVVVASAESILWRERKRRETRKRSAVVVESLLIDMFADRVGINSLDFLDVFRPWRGRFKRVR